jgi:hypothetical protein
MIGEAYFSTRAQLGTALFSLQTLAGDLNAPADRQAALQQLQQSLREPILLLIVGEKQPGKAALLNALFGREFWREDAIATGTDRTTIFKFGEEERIAVVSDELVEILQPAPFLRDFQIVDATGANCRVAGQLAASADLILFVFSAISPWAGSVWSFLQMIKGDGLARTAFILQQSELRGSAETASILADFEQTVRECAGPASPLLMIASSPAESDAGVNEVRRLIGAQISAGGPRRDRLRAVCESAQRLLGELGGPARESLAVVERDRESITHIDHELAEHREQALRQTGGVLWSLAQTYETAQKRGEEVLQQKLGLVNIGKLLRNGTGWRKPLADEIEERLRGAVPAQIENALAHLAADMHDTWTHLGGFLLTAFADRCSVALFPEFVLPREQLLRGIAATLEERSRYETLYARIERLFAQTARWLWVPVTLAIAVALAAFGAVFPLAPRRDLAATAVGVAALTSVGWVLLKRRQIIREFRQQMLQKRENMLSGVEDHLRQAVDAFFTDLTAILAPLHAFCAAQNKLHEPMLTRLDQLTELFSKSATDLGLAPRATSEIDHEGTKSTNN